MNRRDFSRARRAALPVLLCMTLLLCSCFGGVLNPGPPPTRLALAPALPAPFPGGAADKQLVVAMPSCGRELDTDRIATVFANREVEYLADTRWTGTVPALLRATLIEALEATGGLQRIQQVQRP